MKTLGPLLLFCALPALGQPRITNARLETRPAAGGLDAAVRQILAAQASPAWIGYAVPAAPRESQGCCCRLEDGASMQAPAGGTVHLEGPKEVLVFYRVEEHRVGKVRTYSPDCAIDGGGLPFFWLTGVRPPESVAFLAGLMAEPEKIANSALAALAMHADPSAARALVLAAREDKSPRVRGQALFWLAQTAARQIAESSIAEAIEKDPETEVKRRAVFALTQIPGGDGVPLLIQVARTNRNAAVRKQAFFWLGQSKDPRAVKFFEEVLAR